MLAMCMSLIHMRRWHAQQAAVPAAHVAAPNNTAGVLVHGHGHGYAQLPLTFSSILSNATDALLVLRLPIISWICWDVFADAARAFSVSFLDLASASLLSSTLKQQEAIQHQHPALNVRMGGANSCARRHSTLHHMLCITKLCILHRVDQ
jgi:hypothetical protein